MDSNIQVFGLIEAPPRSSSVGVIIVLSVIAAFSLTLAILSTASALTLVLLAGLLSLAIINKAIYAVHAALFIFLWVLLVKLVPICKVWPFNTLTPLIIYGAVAIIIPRLRHSIGWIHGGKIDTKTLKLIIFTAFISAVALIAWVLLAKPDLEHHLALYPELPFWAYPFAGIGFALFNAAIEEAIFRGIIMESLDSALGAGYWSVGIQAIPFAALHYLAGFPNGLMGFAMVLVYGIMLGAIRRISKGMLASFIAHIMTDITIFSILAIILFQHNN